MFTQKRLNDIFEKPQPDMEVCYSLNMYLMMAFFNSFQILPLASLVVFLCLFVNSLVDKFLLYRFFGEPNQEHRQLSEEIMVSVGFLIKAFAFSNLGRNSILRLLVLLRGFDKINSSLLPLINIHLIISLILIFFPFGFLLRLQLGYLQARALRGSEVDFLSSFGGKRYENEEESRRIGDELRENLVSRCSSRKGLIDGFNLAYGSFKKSEYERVNGIREGPHVRCSFETFSDNGSHRTQNKLTFTEEEGDR